MKNISIKAAMVGLFCASLACAETVNLPYQVNDNNGGQWFVYYQGQLQQQGNPQIFSQTAMMTVNGSQLKQPNNQQAQLDDKTREITMSFEQKSSLKIQRRIKFDDESGIVRIVDVFENNNKDEQQLNLQIAANVNYGISNTTFIEDAKRKTQLGWTADTGANKSAMCLWATKGAKIGPNIRYNQGNNNCSAVLNLKVPGKDRIAIVHWYGVFDNSDAANTWAQQLKENKLLADLPADIKKCIVNIGTGGQSGTISGRDLLRGELNDIVELRNGDQMRGDLKLESYQLKTDFGNLTLPASKVICALNVGETRSRQLLVTADGEIFGGELVSQNIPILLSSGQTTQIPMSQIARVGYRTGGTEQPEWQYNQPMVFLRTGERCLIANLDQPIEMTSRNGPLTIKPEQISTIVLKNSGASHEVYLTDGSKISGILTKPRWTLKLLSASGDGKVEFPLAAISRIQIKPLAPDVGVGQATLSMLDGDVVVTRLDGKLKLNTTFDSLDLNAGEIRSITRTDDPSSSELIVTLFDQSVFRGVFASQSVSVKVGSDITLDIPVAALKEYNNPQPFPSKAIVDKVKEQVALLNAEDWKQREAAETVLVNLGPTVIGVLDSSLADQSPEAQNRLQSVMKRLKKDAPPSPSKLTQPPAIE